MPRDELISASRKLDDFAITQGFQAPPALYITGEIHIPLHTGDSLYSDEAHLYCRGCAESLLKKTITLKGPSAEEDHFIYAADRSCGEDTPAHCMTCGETLDHELTRHGCLEEIMHYEDAPSADITAREAFNIARILDTAIWCEDLALRALALAETSLDHISSSRIRAA